MGNRCVIFEVHKRFVVSEQYKQHRMQLDGTPQLIDEVMRLNPLYLSVCRDSGRGGTNTRFHQDKRVVDRHTAKLGHLNGTGKIISLRKQG